MTFDSDGGSDVDSVTVEHGQAASEPAEPTREGYDFLGWYNGNAEYDFSTAVTSDLTLTAQWQIRTYTVTFDSDGGSDVDSVTVEHGQAASEPAEPTREGYDFLGWYNGNAEYDFSTAVTSDLTLTAQWQIRTYTVTFNSDGGTNIDAVTVDHGDTLDPPADPEKDGYIFVCWFVGDSTDESYDFDTPVTSDMTLTANWKATYTTVLPTSAYFSSAADNNDQYEAGENNEFTAPYHEDFVFTLNFDKGYIPGDDFEVTAVLDSTKDELEVTMAQNGDEYTFTVIVNGDAWTGESDTVTIDVTGTYYFLVDNAADLEEALDIEDNVALRAEPNAPAESPLVSVGNDKTLWIVSGQLNLATMTNSGTVVNEGTIVIDHDLSASAAGYVIDNYGTFINKGRVTGGDTDRLQNWDGRVQDDDNGIEITVTDNH